MELNHNPTAKTLTDRGTKAFSDRQPLLSYWQECARYFHPARADMTGNRPESQDFLSDLTTSSSIIMASQLADIFTTTTRPEGRKWFKIGVDIDYKMSQEGHVYLELMTNRLRKYMLSPETGFSRATKEADYDLVAFGNSVKSLEYNANLTGLVFNNWHLKDVVWFEDYNHKVNEVHRNWEPTAIQLKSRFGENIHRNVLELCSRDPYKKVRCRHVVIPNEYHVREDGKVISKDKFPFISYHIDIENQHILEEVPAITLGYIIPRWSTVSNSVYGYSPAVQKALPDVRLLNSITQSILEAGEKAVDPPLVAIEESLRGDINLRSGGITYVSAEGLDGSRPIVQPLQTDKSGLAFAPQIADQIRAQIFESFYLNKLNLPSTNGGMSPFEVSQRIQEFTRNVYPLFAPIVNEDNFVMCNMALEMCFKAGFLGDPRKIPEEFLGRDIKFSFENPIISAQEQEAKQAYLEALNTIMTTAQIDPSAIHYINVNASIRDAMRGNGFRETWFRSDEEIQGIIEQQQMQQQMTQEVEMAKQVGEAGKGIKEAISE